jgi:glycerophosphoryl diester phosphodiesterase
LTEIHPAARLVAHRGHAAEYPENSLPAFASALDLGIAYVECDVQLTADGCPVLLHDADLLRTAGVERRIAELHSREIDALDVGERTRFGTRHAGTHLPRLAELVELLQAYPCATAFVELKRAGLERYGRAAALDRVGAVLRSIERRCVLISFDFDVLRLAQARAWRIGAVLRAYDAEHQRALADLAPEFAFCNHEKLPAGAAALWSGPWRWAAYEITDIALVRRLATRGVELFETMAVAALLRELRLQ